MENNARKKPVKEPSTTEQSREQEAKKKLARPAKDKTEVTIGPTDRTGPDVILS